MEAGGRATQDAVAEKARMRGFKLGSCPVLSPLPNPLPEGEGVNGIVVFDLVK